MDTAIIMIARNGLCAFFIILGTIVRDNNSHANESARELLC